MPLMHGRIDGWMVGSGTWEVGTPRSTAAALTKPSTQHLSELTRANVSACTWTRRTHLSLWIGEHGQGRTTEDKWTVVVVAAE